MNKLHQCDTHSTEFHFTIDDIWKNYPGTLFRLPVQAKNLSWVLLSFNSLVIFSLCRFLIFFFYVFESIFLQFLSHFFIPDSFILSQVAVSWSPRYIALCYYSAYSAKRVYVRAVNSSSAPTPRSCACPFQPSMEVYRQHFSATLGSGTASPGASGGQLIFGIMTLHQP
jgi:hypothetical protein